MKELFIFQTFSPLTMHTSWEYLDEFKNEQRKRAETFLNECAFILKTKNDRNRSFVEKELETFFIFLLS